MESDRRTRVVRFLRIGFSAVCAVLCILLVVLWVRSYSSRDELQGRTSIDGGFELYSMWGRVEWYNWYLHRDNKYPLKIVTYTGEKFPTFIFPRKREDPWRWLDFHYLKHSQYVILAAPHWFLVALTAMMAAAPWIRWKWRFSLRTLLIATTFIAVVLGLIVYAVR